MGAVPEGKVLLYLERTHVEYCYVLVEEKDAEFYKNDEDALYRDADAATRGRPWQGGCTERDQMWYEEGEEDPEAEMALFLEPRTLSRGAGDENHGGAPAP